MTRINVVPVQELGQKHLLAEYREITRPFAKVRKRQAKGQRPSSVKTPTDYALGTGHETFFFTRLQYLVDRYQELTNEMLARGYKANPVPIENLIAGIDKSWFGNYTPTHAAQTISRQRIAERLEGMKNGTY